MSETISEEEQWKIINETGILHKIKRNQKKKPPIKKEKYSDDDSESNPAEDLEDFKDEIMPLWAEVVLISTPLALLHAVFEYVVYIQYGFKNEYSIFRLFRRSLPIFCLLAALTWGTNKVKSLWLLSFIQVIASSLSGVYLIRLTLEGDKTFGTMLKTPGLAVLWIYLIIQMKLTPAALGIVAPLLYYLKDYMGLNSLQTSN
ncbi:hypothetical protein HK096_003663 [Nowakowskiella sp. JEL0078]|nr:hypothetical protein HK096_003663 [Nowakowskiella sp. JEL0078]